MISIGNFFFKYRNIIFIALYIALFIPSRSLFGDGNYLWAIILGLLVTVGGQLVRAATIGLAYIIRGGRDGKVYAEELVTEGIFNHCRNPLYVGNILMLLGVGILSDSLLYVAVLIPIFLFIYHTIVLAEENFLRNKFGEKYEAYCKRVPRWLIKFSGLGTTTSNMHYNWRRYLIKEYNTLYIWLTGITLVLLFKHPRIYDNDESKRNLLLAIILPLLLLGYLFIRYLKKSGKLKE